MNNKRFEVTLIEPEQHYVIVTREKTHRDSALRVVKSFGANKRLKLEVVGETKRKTFIWNGKSLEDSNE